MKINMENLNLNKTSRLLSTQNKENKQMENKNVNIHTQIGTDNTVTVNIPISEAGYHKIQLNIIGNNIEPDSLQFIDLCEKILANFKQVHTDNGVLVTDCDWLITTRCNNGELGKFYIGEGIDVSLNNISNVLFLKNNDAQEIIFRDGGFHYHDGDKVYDWDLDNEINMNEIMEYWKCKECGSDKLEQLAYVNINTDRINDYQDDAVVHCCECGAENSAIERKEDNE